MRRKRRWLLLGLGTAVLLTGGLLFCLIWNGVILLNQPSQEQYPVRGVDVSSYQGEIDWDVLSSEGIQFAFIKATEGSGFTDPYFAVNYAQAQKTDLRIGAYHFFSYDSPGRTQAELFIQTVPKTEGMLPPVVDLEFYGDKRENLPEVQAARRELDILLEELEAHYEKKPILYATEDSYQIYLAGAYREYDIWIRNVISSPELSDGREWTFWQYTNRARLKGYQGAEPFIDLNVFAGSQEEFNAY